MSLEPDERVFRKRLKRRLTIWRIVALLAVVAVVALAFERGGRLPQASHIARLSVTGIILEDQDRLQTLSQSAKDASVKALIVYINSPGGSVVGGESLFRSLRAVAAAKPVAVVMGEMATSAGYMTALGGDRIFAREGSITGSIGVILQSTDITGLLEKLGIATEALKSGPLKAVPSPLEPLTPEARAATMDVIRDVFDMFVGLVADRRSLSRDRALGLADGRVYTGRQALANGLVDEIGGEQEAIGWLAAAHGIDARLPVKDLEGAEPVRLWRRLASAVTGKALFSERLTLDGLVSLWHPNLR
ncbi:MAG: signal peptide peptidase SppA [Alphaproteobacteria bacterium]